MTSKAFGLSQLGDDYDGATGNLTTSGTITANAFVGDGSGLTGITSIPAGVIVMWSGTIGAIPSGWLICDGTNGTPDLRDRFVVGAGSTYAVAATGGAASVTLVESEIPGHTHTYSGSTNTTGAHTHTTSTRRLGSAYVSGTVNQGGNDSSVNYSFTTGSAGDHSHTFSGTTASTGGNGSHENRPPYYALAYIMKT